MKTVQQQH